MSLALNKKCDTLAHKKGGHMISRELQIGKAGEHWVCYDLIMQGYNAFLADQGLPYDVVVDTPQGFKRIQVKTTMKMQKYPNWGEVYGFGLRCAKKGARVRELHETDYFAFFAVDLHKAAYISVDALVGRTGKVVQGVYIIPGDRPTKQRYDSWGRRMPNHRGRYFNEYTTFKV